MPISVRDLLDTPDLQLRAVAGEAGLDHPIRWAHISELPDPTPWLSGGEFLLTTGIGVNAAIAGQRAYVRRLVETGVSGLGFGIGFTFEAVPEGLVRAAERNDLAVLEVPYPIPFIAITEAVSRALSRDRLKDVQMSVEVHERLAALIAEGSGPADLLDEVVALAGGWAMLFDLRGRLLARSRATAAEDLDPDEVWENLPAGLTDRRGPTTLSETSPRGTRVGLVVAAQKRPEAILVFGKDRRMEPLDRIVVHHALTVLSLLLASRRAVIEAERRVAGDVLGEAFSGRLTGADLERRLDLVGFSVDGPLTALVVEAPLIARDGWALEELAWAADRALGRRAGAARTSVFGERVVALIEGEDSEEAAGVLAADLPDGAETDSTAAGSGPDLRLGVGESVDARSIRRSYLSAIFALRAAPIESGLAFQRDLGSYRFLLGAQSRPVLEGFVRSVLGALIDRDETKSSDLVASVKAFIDAGGRWEQGAEALGVHRHTLRYRVRQAEELLRRDLSSAEDRLEVWLALKATEVLDE